MKSILHVLTISLAFTAVNSRTIQEDDPIQRLPSFQHNSNDLPTETDVNDLQEQLDAIFADKNQSFDTSQCPKCDVAEEYERNSDGDVISCRCVRNIHNQFGGDMRLTESTRRWINHLYGRTGRGLIRSSRFHWPKDKDSDNVYVPYIIDSSIDSDRRETIENAIEQFKLRTCIRFNKRTFEDDFLIISDRGGCWSYVGKQGGSQELSIGARCNRIGVVEHELMHSLGFFHEQSRSDRDKYITVQLQNVIQGFESNFDKILRSEIDLGETPYDVGSVMHYGEYAFSRNGQKTIVVHNPGSVQVGQRGGFSEYDLEEINKKYCQRAGFTTKQTTTTTSKTTTTPLTTAPETTTPTERPTRPPTNGCRNKERDEDCEYWKRLGYCTHSFAIYMRVKCKESCGFCE